MASRERSTDQITAVHSLSPIQRSLAFDTPREVRDQTQLLRSLAKALATLTGGVVPESALKESFVHAMAGLGAEKAMLIQVRQEHPLELEILYAAGLSPENEAACRTLAPSPGMSPVLIRKAIEDGEPQLIENSSAPGHDATASLGGRPYSVLCAPVADSLTGGVVAVLYFQSEARR